MTKHHTTNPATALNNALQTAERAAQQLEDWLKQHVTGLPPGTYFYAEPGDFFISWRLEVCHGHERRELDAGRLIANIQADGQMTAAELKDYER